MTAMTVKELREKLDEFEPEAQVFIWDSRLGYQPLEDAEQHKQRSLKDYEEKMVVLLG